ncbi:MAG: septal ring lytic transglycosylase RlpA family protein [candidate division WOR-3 bacterium]
MLSHEARASLWRVALLSLLVVFLSSCIPYTSRTMNLEPAVLLSEVGIASWYGPKFHGGKTASGQIYDMYGKTAAHRTLPFGSVVRVTDLKTGKNTVVIINDRGPFVEGRIIDLSLGAAQEIGLDKNGLAKVKIEVLRLGKGIVSEGQSSQ